MKLQSASYTINLREIIAGNLKYRNCYSGTITENVGNLQEITEIEILCTIYVYIVYFVPLCFRELKIRPFYTWKNE